MADLQVNSLWLMNDFSRALDFSKFMEKSMTQLKTILRCDSTSKDYTLFEAEEIRPFMRMAHN